MLANIATNQKTGGGKKKKKEEINPVELATCFSTTPHLLVNVISVEHNANPKHIL
jgi:hypothetical protein